MASTLTERGRWKNRAIAEMRFRPLPVAFRSADGNTLILMLCGLGGVAADGPAVGGGGCLSGGAGGVDAVEEGGSASVVLSVALSVAIFLLQSHGESDECMRTVRTVQVEACKSVRCAQARGS